MYWYCLEKLDVDHLGINPFTPNSAKFKSWISFCKIVKNKQYHMKVLLGSFHLNGYTLGFHPQTQTLQPRLLTQGLTLGVKGLRL